jgi:hypothetical protein
MFRRARRIRGLIDWVFSIGNRRTTYDCMIYGMASALCLHCLHTTGRMLGNESAIVMNVLKFVGASRKHASTPPPVIAWRDSNPRPALAISLPVPPISFLNILLVPDRSGSTGGVRDLPIEPVGSWLKAPERLPFVLCIGSGDMLTN